MNTTLKQTTPCPNCGRPLPAGAPAGLCPACLLAQGAETDAGGSGGGRARFEPPPLDQITELFPQLEVLRLLGAGGMGAVYQARQPALDRMVALKVLPANGPGGALFEERFNREARALARLSHPNIVAVHEFGRVEGLHFFLMEFVDGANLRQLEQAGRLSPREALQIIPQICDALQYAHDEGVVHRDIKPENVLVDRRGRVKIADFGLAKILGTDPAAARLTVEGQVMGTPHYMAPEQVERPLAVDHRADIYSLGVVFYEMLTGDLPLGKFAPPSRKVQLDVRLDEIVLRALENDPARRYQQASEVKQRVTTVTETPAPASPLPAASGDAREDTPKSGVRYLRWLGIPVVAERDGEREVNFQGALTAVFVTMIVAALAHQIVRWVAGTEHALSRFVWLAGGLTVMWGIRRTMNQPWDDEPQRAANGTVVLAPERRPFPYLADALMLAGLFALIIGGHYFKTLLLARPAGGMKAALARQTAARDPQTGILSVKLPGRGTVELLAVADANAAPNQWWRPDGTPETNLTYELPNPVESSVSGRVSKDFLVRLSDLPSGADHLGFSCDLASGVSSGGQVFRDGRLLSGVIQARTAFPPEAKRDHFRVALALEPWRTIGTQQGHSQSSNQERKLTDPNWQVIFHAPTRNERGEAQISYVFGPEDRLWTHRLIAVDTNGVEHAAHSAQGTPIEKVTLWTCTFDGLPFGQVKEFRLQVRPLHWIVFPDVALQPNSALPQQRIALLDPQTGTLKAAVAQRGLVELLAVAQPDSPPDGWWRPDGRPMKDSVLVATGLNPLEPPRGKTYFDFLFRADALPPGAEVAEINVSGGSTIRGGTVAVDGRTPAGAIRVRADLPKAALLTSFEVGLGLEPWRRLARHDPRKQANVRFEQASEPAWKISLEHREGPNGLAQVTGTYGPGIQGWQVRLIALDHDGVAHTDVTVISKHGPEDLSSTWTFRALPLTEVAEFQLEARPLQFVRFADVSLRPSPALASPQPGLVFSPPALLTVDEVVDLDIGHTASFPTAAPDSHPIAGMAENLAWALEQGFDASVGVNEWDLLSVTLAPISPADWESLTPQEAEARLVAQGARPRTLKLDAQAMPAAYAFRTRDDGLGLLRIVEVSENGQKFVVQLRHAVLPGNTPSGRPAKLDPESHTLVARLPGRGSIELLALTDTDATPGQWWRPDGGPVAGEDYQLALPRSATVSEGVSRHLILRWQGLPDGSTGPFIRGTPDVAWVTVGEAVLADGLVLKNTRLVGIAWPRMPATPALRVGFAMDPWRTICTYNLRTHGTMPSPRRPADPPWTVVVHQAVNSQAGVQATMLLSDHPHAWRTTVVAVDTSGAEHPSTTTTSTRSTSGTKDTALWSHEFPGVTLADLKELQVRVCPIHWAEFTGINLAVRP